MFTTYDEFLLYSKKEEFDEFFDNIYNLEKEKQETSDYHLFSEFMLKDDKVKTSLKNILYSKKD